MAPRQWVPYGDFWMARTALVLCATLCLASLFASPAQAAIGDLVQLPAPFGCISDDGSGGLCSETEADSFFEGANDVVFGSNGTDVYVTASGAISTFRRDPATGRLTHVDCISLGPGCRTPNTELSGAESLALSPDGGQLYVASRLDSTLTIYDRGADGTLTEQPGCFDAFAGEGCVVATGLEGAGGVAVSPDGKSVYVAGEADDAIASFDRDTDTGELEQKDQTDGCVAEVGTPNVCADGEALEKPEDIVVSPDGESVYVASFDSRAIAIFDRNTTTGVLDQKDGTAGCVANFNAACTPGRGVAAVSSLALSPDGEHLYAGSSATNDGLATFDRVADGGLTQKPGAAGCVSADGNAGTCGVGDGLDGVFSVGVSADGKSLYSTSTFDDAIGIFDRDVATGVLTQKARPKGCISPTGSDGICEVGVVLDTGLSSPTASPDGKTVVVGVGPGVAIFARDAPGAGLPSNPNPPPPPPGGGGTTDPPELRIGSTKVFTNASVAVKVFPFGPGLLGFSATAKYKKPKPRASARVTVAKKRKRVTKAGAVTVVLKATRAARKVLKRKGRLKSNLKITFTPETGPAVTEKRQVTFKLKRKRSAKRR